MKIRAVFLLQVPNIVSLKQLNIADDVLVSLHREQVGGLDREVAVDGRQTSERLDEVVVLSLEFVRF